MKYNLVSSYGILLNINSKGDKERLSKEDYKYIAERFTCGFGDLARMHIASYEKRLNDVNNFSVKKGETIIIEDGREHIIVEAVKDFVGADIIDVNDCKFFYRSYKTIGSELNEQIGNGNNKYIKEVEFDHYVY